VKKFLSLFKPLNLRQIVTVFLAGAVLFVTTACNPANYAQGADANKNLPVQVGGQNNPAKGGGDSLANSKTMARPGVTEKPSPAHGKQAALPFASNSLIAATLDSRENQSKLLYPGSDKLNTPERINALEQSAEEAAQQAQPVLTQTDPNANLLEKTQQQFQDASKFIGEKAEEAAQRPEMQRNPAVGK
jgi:hypothetical protein